MPGEKDHFDNLHKRADLYRRVFNTPDGREVMRDLMCAFNYDSSSFAFVIINGEAQQLDPYFTIARVAKRECFDYIANLTGLTYEHIVALKFYAEDENVAD